MYMEARLTNAEIIKLWEHFEMVKAEFADRDPEANNFDLSYEVQTTWDTLEFHGAATINDLPWELRED